VCKWQNTLISQVDNRSSSIISFETINLSFIAHLT
jgi:hypothetical protein